MDKIAELEKSLEDHKTAHKEERESNRQAAEASDKKDAAEDAPAEEKAQ